MKSIKKIIIGSKVFFDCYDDYTSKDIDEIHIMDSFKLKGTNVVNLKDKDKDIFFFRNMTKEEFIKDTLESNVPMRAGKFLVPEFVSYINLTIQDLKQFENLFSIIDEKHMYEKIIYDSYIENNDFYLTNFQRDKAYSIYKKTRK